MSKQNPAKADSNQFDINESSYKTSHTAVRKARRFALQGLYEWLMTDHRFEQTGQGEWQSNAPHDIAARTRANNAMHTVHLGYYHEMMRDIPEQIEELEVLISQHLDRHINQIDMVEHAVLLIGAYELKYSLHIPYKVVLDEAMKLNTHFGATDAHKLINAVMDKLAAELRTLEVEADTEHKDKVAEKAAHNKASLDANAKPNLGSEPVKPEENHAETLKNVSKPRIGRKSMTQSKAGD